MCDLCGGFFLQGFQWKISLGFPIVLRRAGVAVGRILVGVEKDGTEHDAMHNALIKVRNHFFCYSSKGLGWLRSWAGIPKVAVLYASNGKIICILLDRFSFYGSKVGALTRTKL